MVSIQVYTMYGAAFVIALIISIIISLLIWFYRLRKIKRETPNIELNTKEDIRKINFDNNYIERRLVNKDDRKKEESYRGGNGGERTSRSSRVTRDEGEQDNGRGIETDEDSVDKSGLQEQSRKRDGVSLPNDNKFDWD